MNPPARPLRRELNDALVEGIRERGSEAVGLMIVAFARISIAAVLLVLLLIGSRLLDFEVSAVPFVGMTGISASVSWLLTRKRDGPR